VRTPNKALHARVRLSVIGVAVVAAVTLGAVAAVNMGSGHGKPDAKGTTTPPTASGATTATPSAPARKLTPETSPRKIVPLKPREVKNGIGVGFPHTAVGAESAAISYWQDLDILDDGIARRQWTQITSKTSPGTVDKHVTDVRKVREGVGLPPSGGTPAGLSFTTVVKAALMRSRDDSGDVIEVWMFYDRYATLPAAKAADNAPLTDQEDDLILTWEDGDWRVTEAPQYVDHKYGPVAYDPHSTFAFDDGWREVVSQ
jgi:hypothetical protein